MLDSVLGGVVVLFLAAVALFFVNPIIALVPLLLLVGLLGIRVAGGLFRHAAPSSNTDASGGPAVPSSRDASYEPVSGPADRR
jgi:hypothetical protein